MHDIPSNSKATIQKKLLNWYRKNRRELPFRDSGDPYKIWISEVMLQQTQVKTVLPFYEKFIRLFPTVQALAHADTEKILKAWEGLGYYSRARNLKKAAIRIVDEHQCALPEDHKQLMALPGIGSYIAAAILSIAFSKAYAVVDGNVKRVYARLFMMDEMINKSASLKIYQRVSDQMLARKEPGDYNQAVMELGALICTPKHPQCGICPLNEICRARKEDTVLSYPKKMKRKSTPLILLTGALIQKKTRFLVLQREQEGLLGGLWEFPNYTLNSDPLPNALEKKIKEQLGLIVETGAPIGTVKHTYTHFKAELTLYECHLIDQGQSVPHSSNHDWILFDEIHRLPFSKISHKLFPKVKPYLKPV